VAGPKESVLLSGEGEIAEDASQGCHRWPVRLPEGARDLVHQLEFLAAAVLGI